MPKQHFRKAVSMIVLVMFLFSMAVFYSPSYQSNLAGMADWKDEPVTQNGNPITIGQGMKEITLYPVDDEGNYEGYKEAGTGKLKVKFKVDDSGKATLVKAYAKKPFIMGGDERECGNANQCKQMMDTEMEPKDKDDFNKMVGAFETGYAQQNPSTEPAPPPESNVEEDEDDDDDEDGEDEASEEEQPIENLEKAIEDADKKKDEYDQKITELSDELSFVLTVSPDEEKRKELVTELEEYNEKVKELANDYEKAAEEAKKQGKIELADKLTKEANQLKKTAKNNQEKLDTYAKPPKSNTPGEEEEDADDGEEEAQEKLIYYVDGEKGKGYTLNEKSGDKKGVSFDFSLTDDDETAYYDQEGKVILVCKKNDCTMANNLGDDLNKYNKLGQLAKDSMAVTKTVPLNSPNEEEEKKEETKEEQKPKEQKSSSKIGGLDTEGDVFVCEKDNDCDPSKASFTFKHHSVFQGTEGYVYATADGKRCTAADAASGGDCAKRKCDNVKGCVHESEGSIYCTTFDGLKRCAGDPTGYIEKTIEACDKKAYAGPECTGAQKKMDATYDNLNFEFRSRVESVFGTLLDDWTENAFSRLEYWLYDSVCTMDYYNTGESETDVISGLTITQEHNFGFNLGYLDEGEVIVTLGGEKEVVDENAFRYSFTLQTIGPIHGIVYLYNHCTKKKSFGSEYTGAYGWMDEFAVNNPLGVHRIHYAGDETTFVCDGDGTNFKKQECRFDHVCLKILDNDKYVKPICNVLGGEEFIIDVDNGDYSCGQMPANYYKS